MAAPLLVFSIVSSFTTVQAANVFFTNPVDWATAYSACKNNGGTLLGKVLTSEEDIKQYDEAQPLWVDAFVTWTPWMANSGCFRYKEDYVDKTDNSELVENSAAKCLQHCGNNLPFGLSNNTCYCNKSRFHELKKVSGSYCNINCTGNINDMCGGIGTSNFHKYLTVFDRIDDSIRDTEGIHGCLAVSREGNDYIFSARNCNKPKHVLCQNSGGRTIGSTTLRKWYEARKKCKEFNLELIDRKSISQSGIQLEDIEYWTGYYRNADVIWHPNKTLTKSNDCYILIKDGRYQYQIEKCNQNHSYVCTTTDLSDTVSSTMASTKTVLYRNNPEGENEDSSVVIGASVGGVLILVIAAIAIIVICLRKRRKRDAKNVHAIRQSCSMNTKTEEGEVLIHTDEVYSKPNNLQTNNSDSYSIPVIQSPKNEKESDTYDHLKLNGQRVSFRTDSDNTYDVTGLDSDGISRIDGASKYQPIKNDDTYDHATDISSEGTYNVLKER